MTRRSVLLVLKVVDRLQVLAVVAVLQLPH